MNIPKPPAIITKPSPTLVRVASKPKRRRKRAARKVTPPPPPKTPLVRKIYNFFVDFFCKFAYVSAVLTVFMFIVFIIEKMGINQALWNFTHLH